MLGVSEFWREHVREEFNVLTLFTMAYLTKFEGLREKIYLNMEKKWLKDQQYFKHKVIKTILISSFSTMY